MAYEQNNRDQRQRTDEPRINRRIRFSPVRVVMDDGSQLGVIPTYEALKKAEDLGLDLVEISPNARPPVCKIMDYGKYKYEQKKVASEQRKKQSVVEIKEIKFRPGIGDHDFETKLGHIKSFITDGNKCRVTVMFRGREMQHTNIGMDILKRVTVAVADIAFVESHPRLEMKNMQMTLSPGKQKKTA